MSQIFKDLTLFPFLDQKFFWGAKIFFWYQKILSLKFFWDQKFFQSMNFFTQIFSDPTLLFLPKLNKLYLKLEFDTEDQVLLNDIFGTRDVIHRTMKDIHEIRNIL